MTTASTQFSLDLIRAAEQQGWQNVTDKRSPHYKIKKNGHSLTIARTPSDYRAHLNNIAMFKRMGGVWPPPKKEKRENNAMSITHLRPYQPTPTMTNAQWVLQYVNRQAGSVSILDIVTAGRAEGYREESLRPTVSVLHSQGKLVACGWRTSPATGRMYAMFTIAGRASDVPKPQTQKQKAAAAKPAVTKSVPDTEGDPEDRAPVSFPWSDEEREKLRAELKGMQLAVQSAPPVVEVKAPAQQQTGGAFYLGIAKAFEGMAEAFTALAER